MELPHAFSTNGIFETLFPQHFLPRHDSRLSFIPPLVLLVFGAFVPILFALFVIGIFATLPTALPFTLQVSGIFAEPHSVLLVALPFTLQVSGIVADPHLVPILAPNVMGSIVRTLRNRGFGQASFGACFSAPFFALAVTIYRQQFLLSLPDCHWQAVAGLAG